MARSTQRRARVQSTGRQAPSAEEMLDEAIGLAEALPRGWSSVRLHAVAERLGVPPAAVLVEFRDLDAMADAWFARALAAMIAEKPAGFIERPARQRIEICVLAWFDALAPHRQVTAQMLRTKLHLPHPHHWVPAVFNLSRTIHWLREAARLPAPYGGRRSQVEEIGLTALFLSTLAVWCRDDSEGQERTRRFLRGRLQQADRLLARIPGL